ncbi:hypothetical protein L6164_021738 [Bauhinia variegata]|uniref:Uncharacterized protein n=1 Tax=Bauhinia variegata TaxID=167791 RepID=A0ACB9MCP8_BAUVA|nr:hypothetical protein L6164_021738 [Bauhinia variegata]
MATSSSSRVITCKAAVCWGIGESVKIEEIQVEAPKESEVRVKMLCASLCHTDISSTRGFPQTNFPQVLGHEGVGVVESVGENVSTVKAGDVVIPTYIGECGECENCVSGKSNLCLRYPLSLTGLMPDNTSRMSVGGHKLYHVFSCATWSEYAVIHSGYLVKVDPTIDLAHASFISCGFSTGFGAAWKEARLETGSSVVVFGLGAVGLGVISGAKMLGATNIIGVDINNMKKAKGEVFGMTHFINPSECESEKLIKDLSGGMGVDYSFECTGVASLLSQAIEATKVGKGKTIAIGTGTEALGPINFAALMMGRTVKGSIFGGIKPMSDLSILAQKCLKKEIPFDELFTHQLPLQDINKAFELSKQPDCVKIVIKM